MNDDKPRRHILHDGFVSYIDFRRNPGVSFREKDEAKPMDVALVDSHDFLTRVLGFSEADALAVVDRAREVRDRADREVIAARAVEFTPAECWQAPPVVREEQVVGEPRLAPVYRVLAAMNDALKQCGLPALGAAYPDAGEPPPQCKEVVEEMFMGVPTQFVYDWNAPSAPGRLGSPVCGARHQPVPGDYVELGDNTVTGVPCPVVNEAVGYPAVEIGLPEADPAFAVAWDAAVHKLCREWKDIDPPVPDAPAAPGEPEPPRAGTWRDRPAML